MTLREVATRMALQSVSQLFVPVCGEEPAERGEGGLTERLPDDADRDEQKASRVVEPGDGTVFGRDALSDALVEEDE